jgi:hypothetical protein
MRQVHRRTLPFNIPPIYGGIPHRSGVVLYRGLARHHCREEGERHHGHTPLKKRDFPKHPPAFVCRVLAPEHEQKPYGRPVDEQR